MCTCTLKCELFYLRALHYYGRRRRRGITFNYRKTFITSTQDHFRQDGCVHELIKGILHYMLVSTLKFRKMSFKRDGNDSVLLNATKKRRITELLASDIPEDEAYLMKNGRFACMICPHRPIFDTVNMLAVHRNGKKHAASQTLHNEKKEDLVTEVQKRQQEYFMKDGKPCPLGPGLSSEKFLSANIAYNPRSKRKMKITERKPVVNLKNTRYSNDHCSTDKTRIGSSNTGTCFLQKINEANDHSLKNRRSYEKQQSCNEASKHNCARESHLRCMALEAVTNSPVNKHKNTGVTEMTKEEKEKMREKYMQLGASGWIKDKDGKWIKDEDAEFDSDEETPNLA